jgi:hypothetical protein
MNDLRSTRLWVEEVKKKREAMGCFCRNGVRVLLGSDKGDILEGSVGWFQQMRHRHMPLQVQLQYDVERNAVWSGLKGSGQVDAIDV